MTTKSKANTKPVAGFIRVQAGPFAVAMKDARLVVEWRNTIPILCDVLIEASATGLVITGTDLDIWYRESIGHETDSGALHPFRACVSAEKLGAIVAIADRESVIDLSYEDGNLDIAVPVAGSGDARWTLCTLPPDDFPDFGARPNAVSFEMDAFALAAMLAETRYAVSTERARYYLNGVFLHLSNGLLKAAATDGHRLAMWQCDLPPDASGLPDAIIPRKMVAALDAVFDRFPGEAPVMISMSATEMAAELGEITIIGKLIDGTFPEYARVIPTGNTKRATVDPKRFAEAVRRVRLISSEKVRAIKCHFASNALTLSMVSPECGDARETIRCELDGEPVSMCYNAQYLIDALDRFAAVPSCTIMLEGAADPSWFKASDDARASHVLMPMRV